MMPLMLADAGTEQLIHKVGGSPEVKKHLEDLGFTPGIFLWNLCNSLN